MSLMVTVEEKNEHVSFLVPGSHLHFVLRPINGKKTLKPSNVFSKNSARMTVVVLQPFLRLRSLQCPRLSFVLLLPLVGSNALHRPLRPLLCTASGHMVQVLKKTTVNRITIIMPLIQLLLLNYLRVNSIVNILLVILLKISPSGTPVSVPATMTNRSFRGRFLLLARSQHHFRGILRSLPTHVSVHVFVPIIHAP